MKKEMKNKLIILIYAFVLNGFQLVAQNAIFVLDSTSVLNVSIARGDNTSYSIDLIYENTTEDTLLVSSKYFIDSYSKTTRILIYRCEKISPDSLECRDGYYWQETNPISVSFNNERFMRILPQENKVIRMPLSHIEENKEVYLQIRMVCQHKGTWFILTKTTNRIFFDKEPDKYEKYQMEKARKREDENKE